MSLKEVRKELRFAQNVVAKASNIKPAYLSLIENEFCTFSEKIKNKLINGYLSLGYDVTEKIEQIYNKQRTDREALKGLKKPEVK